MRQLASSLSFPYLKRQTTFFTNFWHSGEKSDLTKNVTVMLPIVLAEAALR
jgi:hypothetical protein